MTLRAVNVQAMSFSGSLLQGGFTPTLTRTLATSIARAVPVVGASAGFVYRFDWETGSFQREPAILGQLYLEGPDPVGRGRLDVSASYQRVQIDTVQGMDIRDLSDMHAPIFIPPGPPRVPLLTIPHFGINLGTNQVTVGFTYGVTDNLEVNAAVPILQSDLDVNGAVQVTTATGFQTLPFRSSASATGVGDLLLRGKYRLVERNWLHLASGLVLRVPTGNTDDFQGTGDVELAPMVYASREPLAVGKVLRFRPYLNAGFDFNADNVNASEARWGTGLDGALGERFAVGVAVLTRYPISRLGPPGLFDVRRGQNGQFSEPLFGLSSKREEFYDFSVGGRLNVWRDRVNLFANALLPLNRDGARADVIPLAGAEVIF